MFSWSCRCVIDLNRLKVFDELMTDARQWLPVDCEQLLVRFDDCRFGFGELLYIVDNRVAAYANAFDCILRVFAIHRNEPARKYAVDRKQFSHQLIGRFVVFEVFAFQLAQLVA